MTGITRTISRTAAAVALALALAALVVPYAGANGNDGDRATSKPSITPAASYYTPQQLQVMSERYAAKAAFDSLTPQQRKALSDAWTAQARAISDSQSGSGGFGWGDFGIGAAAMLGLGLLAGGFAATTRYSRRGHLLARFGA